MAAIINNVAASWSMIQLSSSTLTGAAGNNPTILQGVSAVKWNAKRKIESNYGLGGEPISRGFGNKEYTASITMDYNTQAELRALYGSLIEIGQFDLTITWALESGLETDSPITTESVILKGCVFTEDGLEVSQDDTNITKEFDLNPFRIVIGKA